MYLYYKCLCINDFCDKINNLKNIYLYSIGINTLYLL